MYQVLYRKWRPKSFDDVAGQDHIVKTLQNEIKLNRVGHAYLFIGSRGTGKTTCAKIFSKAINCLNPIDGNPCNECEICKSIDNGSAVDVVEMDAASNNGVNDVRSICEEAVFTPVMTKFRVYIIDEVHMLSIGAFNALLKTLEEPSEHVVFILATTEVHKIPATILSRCQRFEFNRIKFSSICDRINFIAQEENIKISQDALYLIARLSDGALRDALSILDKCVSLSDNITVDLVSDTIGVIDNEYLFKTSRAIASADTSQVLKIIDELCSKSKDMMRFCEEVVCHFRDLMLVMTMKNPKEIMVVPDDEIEALQKISLGFSIEKVIAIISVIEEAIQKMSRGCNRRVESETAFVKICLLVKGLDVKSQTKTSEKLQSSKKKPENVIVSDNDKTSKSHCDQIDVSLNNLVENAKPFVKWPEVLKVLKGYSQTISAAFNGSTAYISDNYVLIDVKNQMAFELLRKSSQRDKMRTAIKEVTGNLYKLGPYKKQVEEKNVDDPLDEFAKDILNKGVEVVIN